MAQTNNRLTGSVKWFNDIKRYGFITPDDGGEDCFVHQTSIRSDGFCTLAEGQLVEFLISEDEDGRVMAVDVTGPDGSSIQGASNGSGGGGGGGGGACYSCGEAGHIARDCYHGGGGGGGRGSTCYNCGETGHLARDCSGSSGGGSGRYAGGGGGGDRSCYNCGDMGHFAKDCPDKNKSTCSSSLSLIEMLREIARSIKLLESRVDRALSETRDFYEAQKIEEKKSIVQEQLAFLNNASKKELEGIKEIGKKRAKYILELRKEIPKPFKSVDDLRKLGLSQEQINAMMVRVLGDF